MKKIITFVASFFLVAALRAENVVQVVGHQLLVNGKPYAIKGICYSPVPKGGTYPNDLLTLHPTPKNLAIMEKDFQMMQAAGVNTLRVYAPILNRAILDLLEKYQLHVIVPVCNAYYNANQDNVSTTVQALKNEPTTLFWEVGNECNLNYFNTVSATSLQGIGLKVFAKFAESIIAVIRDADTTHPISLDLGRPSDEVAAMQQPFIDGIEHVDLYGLNFYNGLSISDVFRNRELMSNKPFYFSEVGATAYNLGCNGVLEGALANDVSLLVAQMDFYFLFGFLSPQFCSSNPVGALPGGGVFGEDENAQADGITSLLSQIKENLSTANPDNFLIGGCIFEWNDEWWKASWKNSPEDFWMHSINGACLANEEGILSWGPYPDHYFHEEWFGITTIDRVPRAAYFALQKIYLEP